MYKSYEEYYKFLSSLPEELYVIFSQCWDDTGRPTCENPKKVAIQQLLFKNSNTNELAFANDYQMMFPSDSKENSNLIYHSFICGAQYIASKLNEKKS